MSTMLTIVQYVFLVLWKFLCKTSSLTAFCNIFRPLIFAGLFPHDLCHEGPPILPSDSETASFVYCLSLSHTVYDFPEEQSEEMLYEVEGNTEQANFEDNPCCIRKKCRKCIACAVELLHDLNQEGSMYTSLYTAYKYILTLSCTQVSCERIFSVLKVIKTRIRSSIGQELLESFILFYVNRSFNFDYKRVVDTVASSSSELSRNLKLWFLHWISNWQSNLDRPSFWEFVDWILRPLLVFR